MVLIALSDPLANTDIRPNRVAFVDCYCRFLETELLLFAYFIISRDFNTNFKATEEDKDNTVESIPLVVVIGEYDCFRYSAFLILLHYSFVLINGLAFSFK
jgi:hypothetical protein